MPFSRGVITRDRSHLRARTLPCCRRAARSISSVSSSAQPQCAGVVPTASKGGHLDVSRRVLCCRRSFPAAAHAGRLGHRRATGLSGARQAGDGFVPPGAVPLRRQTPLDTGSPRQALGRRCAHAGRGFAPGFAAARHGVAVAASSLAIGAVWVARAIASCSLRLIPRNWSLFRGAAAKLMWGCACRLSWCTALGGSQTVSLEQLVAFNSAHVGL